MCALPTSLRPLTPLLAAALVAGCATTAIPEAIRTAPANNPSIRVALDAADKLVGTPVRWGGTIAQVDNKQNETWIELVQKDLRNSGQPLASDHSEGRFVARVAGFLDPAIYSKGREMTVAGTLDQPLPGRIGEFGYLFPVVKANTVYLWEKEPDVVYYDPMPYWYYDPWYPYRFPYHYYPPYWRR